MTSKEALKQLNNFISREKHINSERNKTINECINTIKQDLEHLEALEKENKKWREIVGCDLCEALGREILLEENEKLKKIIKENFCYSPNALYDKVFFKWTGPVMEDEIIEVLDE